MTSEQASRIVLLSGAGMATFTLIQASREGRPNERTFRTLWAIGLLTLGLAIFADFVPEVAGPFALLVLIAMAVRNTGALGSVIGGAGAPARKSPPVRGGKSDKK
jgi:hypothetical protein